MNTPTGTVMPDPPRGGRKRSIRFVLLVTLGLNLLVALTKIAIGFLIRSLSLQADGFHSLLDGTSNVVGLVAISYADRPPDRDHPYGHRKFETLAAMVISLFLFLSGLHILQHAVDRLRNPEEIVVGIVPIAALIATMVVNLFITSYESRKGRELKSEFLLADSLHTRTDFYGALLVLVSLILTRFGYPRFDAIGAVIIVAILARAGYRIILDAFEALSDRVRIDPGDIFRCVMDVPSVRDCHKIRSRGAADSIYVDLHIKVDPAMPTSEGHSIQHAVMRKIQDCFPQVADIVVHLEPSDAPGPGDPGRDIPASP
jgi:cation diffusion facilitator family transporter